MNIWDTSMWIRLGLEGAAQSNQIFGASHENRAHLGAQLLLYDKIVIPTKDFGIIPILNSWCGTVALTRLLKAKAISFVWHEFHIAYAGNGGGLRLCCVDEPHSGWENWQQVTRWGAMEDAAEAQIDNMLSSLPQRARTSLRELVLENSTEASVDLKSVVKETTKDFAEIADWNYAIRQENPGHGFYINRLSGIGEQQIRVPPHNEIKDGIDLVLRVAEFNSEIAMAAQMSCDLGTSPNASILLCEKLRRSGASQSQLNNFISLLDLEQLPDLRPAIANGEVTLEEISKLRETADATKFRTWLHETGAQSPRELEQAYVDVIGRDRASKLPVKAVRFAVTTAAGLIPGVGQAIAAVDSFFVDKWLNGYSPKLFIEALETLALGPNRGKPG